MGGRIPQADALALAVGFRIGFATLGRAGQTMGEGDALSIYETIPKELWYPAIAFLMLFLVLVFVPKDRIRELFPTCLIWGGIGSLLFNVSAQGLGLFRYLFIKPFELFGAPLWLSLTWPMGNILFLHFRPEGTLKYALWLLTFSNVSASIDAVFHGLGLVTYYHWSPLVRFFIALLWFGGGTIFHDRVMKT